MSNFRVRLTASARRDFKNLPDYIREKFWRELHFISLEKDPKQKLDRVKGFPGVYKMRAGEFRVILEVLEDELVLLVIEAGPRKTVYRKYQS